MDSQSPKPDKAKWHPWDWGPYNPRWDGNVFEWLLDRVALARKMNGTAPRAPAPRLRRI